ncbi:MAG: NPCBM/NEW2 domain-containing protein [Akkermansia sp.]
MAPSHRSPLPLLLLAGALLSPSPLWAATATAPVVTETNLVMTRQSHGEARLNESVDKNPLNVGGKNFKQGVGTHSTSMIPVNIPTGVTLLSGACGIDDEVKGEGSVCFTIMSGSEILWQSPVMKKGNPAKTFSIPLPAGASMLYLLTDEVDNTDNDHADWLNLKWNKQGSQANANAIAKKKVILNAANYGLRPNTDSDQSPALRKAISAARAKPGCTLNIPKGTYHFKKEGALKMCFNISNHDQATFQPVCVPLIDLKGITIEGNGSLFLFHGLVQPVTIMDSDNTTVRNLAIDYARSHCTEGHVVATDDNSTTLSIDEKQYPFIIRDGKLRAINDGLESSLTGAIAFAKDTKHILPNTSDLNCDGTATLLSPGIVKLGVNLGSKGLKKGDALAMRDWSRPYPAITIYRANKTKLQQVAIHQTAGMALLAQRSTDIAMKGGGIFIRKGSGRSHTAKADATHFSNVKGRIIVENALFEGMMDDAINVHATCLGLEEIVDSSTIRCKYKHGQAVGFEVFLPGEKIQFIAGPTLENGDIAKVKSVRKLSTNELLITLQSPLPSSVKVGDAVENGDYYPSVIFRGNTIRNNRARGSLFTTPKPVLVENNLFDHSSGSAILLAGDAQGWYESGACENVIIRKNKFINNLTSRYQFTNAIISICPEVKQIDKQRKYYHRNILIVDNEFDTFNVPLISAISTEDLSFRNNTIRYNNEYNSWNQPRFNFIHCKNMVTEPNTYIEAKK